MLCTPTKHFKAIEVGAQINFTPSLRSRTIDFEEAKSLE